VRIYKLFEDGRSLIPLMGEPHEAPMTEDLHAIVAEARQGQERLKQTSIEHIIGLCDFVARAWMSPEHPLAPTFQEMGIAFVPLWMRRNNLDKLCDLSARGNRSSLDEFVPLMGDETRRFRAQPRGLIVHWVSGNVPVLGMLSLLQGLLTKNANIIKAPAEFAGLLPILLESIASMQYETPDGDLLSGRLLTDAVSVIYVDREDQEAEQALSVAAELRLAWGGQTAVEGIMNLPRRFGTEDIVFGPKVSFIVVGAERLNNEEEGRSLAEAIARDASVFDQEGCNSPHTVFVERGGLLSPQIFAEYIGEALAAVAARRPLRQVAPADSMNVLTLRALYHMKGSAFHSEGMGWSVLYDDDDRGLADPCYLRTVFVRPVDDIFETVPFCSINTQTVGLAVDGRRVSLAEALTALGVERCPHVGNMSLYETPWDGVFPMDRMVRWTSLD
jgi:hypothetical protein